MRITNHRIWAATTALAAGLALFTTTATPTALAESAPSTTPAWNAPHRGTVAGVVTGAAAHKGIAKAERTFALAKRDSAPQPASTATTTAAASTYVHKWWGVKLTTGSATVSGVQATHSVNASLRMTNSGDYLYSPTTKPRQGACIESTTATTASYAQLWAYDWCADDPGVGARITIDSAFLAKYTKTVDGQASYQLQILRTDASTNTWTAYLYNYTTGAWESYYTSGGTDGGSATFGWDEFEFYSYLDDSTGETYLCDGYAGVTTQSSGIKIRTGTSTWADATTSNTTVYPSSSPSPSDYYCGTLAFTTVSANTHWKVTG